MKKKLIHQRILTIYLETNLLKTHQPDNHKLLKTIKTLLSDSLELTHLEALMDSHKSII
jgi:hypothetical protein